MAFGYTTPGTKKDPEQEVATDSSFFKKDPCPCPQLPGTILRISIPAGAVINLLNLLEITSPSGICLIIRIPVICKGNLLASLCDSIKAAGGSIELVQ